MRWTVVFFDGRVEAALLKLQPSFVARFIRYAERMEEFGPNLGMPHTRAMGDGLFELRLKTPVKELAIARKRLEETAG